MEENKNTASKALTVPEKTQDQKMKEQYGCVYKVGVTIPIDDEKVREFSYYFKRPSIPSYDRYVQSMSKIGPSKASKNFLMDNVVEEDLDRLVADAGEWPAVAISVGNKLMEILGLTDNVNLKRL